MHAQHSVLVKTYDFLKNMLPMLSRFPRDQKFLLGDRIQNLLSDLLELLIEAWYVSPQEKKPLLARANILLEKIRYYARLCYESGYYNSNKFKEISQQINEIGSMVGGWIKSLK